MSDVLVILYLVVTGEVQAAYIGETAMQTCLRDLVTYERDAACSPPTSDIRPYLGLGLTKSPRPRPRPEAL